MKDKRVIDMPSRSTSNKFDYREGVRLSLKEGVLFIDADSFQYFDESIICDINSMDNRVKIVVFRGKAEQNETASFNEFCDLLKRCPCNKKIVIDVGEDALVFGHGVDLDFEILPEHVKLSNVYDFNGLTNYIGENSFDWWCLNLSEDRFRLLLNKVTPLTRERMLKLDYLAKEAKELFYSRTARLDEKGKMDFVFNWFRNNIGFDYDSVALNGGIKRGHKYCQDQYETYKRKLGVCAGRARLLKTMLNNRYMNVPCFVVRGYGLGDMHEWNALLLGDSVLYYDLSSRDVNGVLFSQIKDKYEISDSYDIDSSIYYMARKLVSKTHEYGRILPPPLPSRNRPKQYVKTPPPLPGRND